VWEKITCNFQKNRLCCRIKEKKMKKTTPLPQKPGNLVARDLRTPKYKMRVVGNKKKDHRKLAEILGKIAC